MFFLFSDNIYTTFYVNSCEQTGRKAITCNEGYTVKVLDVQCVPQNFTCPEKDYIAQLCDGLGSCSNVDIRRQLVKQCMNYPDWTAYTYFKCIPGTSMLL